MNTMLLKFKKLISIPLSNLTDFQNVTKREKDSLWMFSVPAIIH